MSRTSVPKPCTFPNCAGSARIRGLCSGHHQQSQVGRDLTPLRAKKSKINSDKDNRCSFEDCSNKVIAQGLCSGHYQQRRDGRELAPLRQINTIGCSVSGCLFSHSAKGFCATHYTRVVRTGSTETGHAPSKIVEKDGHLEVQIRGEKGVGLFALVSFEDRDKVEGKCWFLDTGGYARTGSGNDKVYMHSLVLPTDEAHEVDHIDGNILNNQRSNLRPASDAEQPQNVAPWGASGHRNVGWDAKNNAWRVIVTKDRKQHSGGRHKKLEDALEAARLLRDILFTHHVKDRC